MIAARSVHTEVGERAPLLHANDYEELVASRQHGDRVARRPLGLGSAPQLVVDNHSLFDFDQDGLPDLAIGDPGPSSEIVVFLSTQNGYVRAATLSQGGEMTVGDFNGDGFDDLAATTIDGVDVYLSTP